MPSDFSELIYYRVMCSETRALSLGKDKSAQADERLRSCRLIRFDVSASHRLGQCTVTPSIVTVDLEGDAVSFFKN